jgi:hypothetical protein
VKVKTVIVTPSSTHGGDPALARRRARRSRLGIERGVAVVPTRIGSAVVTQREVEIAVAALRKLPAADIALLAERGIKIQLLPVRGLEDGLLGATTIIRDDDASPWYPTEIRVAAQAGLGGVESLGEIVQHEAGHAVEVVRNQDRSERAAIAYARRH